MDFEFSEEQRQLGDMVRRLLSDRASSQNLRTSLADDPAGYDRDLWRAFADMGLLGMTIAEDYGGLGLRGLELCAVATEMGRSLPRIPWASTIYFASETLSLCGSEAQKQRWLRAVASGDAFGAFAEVPALDVAGETLSGSLPIVPDGGTADFLIVSTGGAAWLVDLAGAGIVRTPVQTFDPLRPAVAIQLRKARAEALPHASAAILSRVMERAAVPLAFEQIGGAERMLAVAVDYALVRKAFGRPIGSFQAVKALLADMYVAATLARSNGHYAAWSLAEAPGELARAAAAARISATGAYRLCAASAIQVHGGIGFTWEIDCHFHYRRAYALGLALGGMRPWQDRLIDGLRTGRAARSGEAA